MKSEVNKRLTTCTQTLDSLGAERETTADQMKYLLEIAMRFREISSSALTTKYGIDNLFDLHPELRLPTAVVDRNQMFSEKVEKMGHTYEFHTELQQLESECISPPRVINVNDESDKSSGDESDDSYDPSLYVRTSLDCSELSDILYDNERICKPDNDGILSWLTEVYKNSRGFELGTFDASILAITMKKQSSNWDPIALGYVSDMVVITHRYITVLLESICPDGRVRSTLLSTLMDGLLERYHKAFDQVNFILQVERSETPLTLNHYFNENLEKW